MTDASTEEVPVRPLNASRVEAFSDGVMAIAITLLVIDIRLPESQGDLLKQLLGLWPSYLAYLGSFGTIGVIWLSHHAFFARIRQVNGLLQVGNLLVLKPGYPVDVVRGETRQAIVAFVALAAIAAIGLVVPIAALILYLVSVVGYALPALAWPSRLRGQAN
ncbi:TMEM175 family protein [Nocardia sp. NBC_00511]|uniref:TMEM175 family protein n=1 Tax=Nocardia sp. NBC_00511 TaxID=2903591 RepID=UPI0030E5B655